MNVVSGVGSSKSQVDASDSEPGVLLHTPIERTRNEARSASARCGAASPHTIHPFVLPALDYQGQADSCTWRYHGEGRIVEEYRSRAAVAPAQEIEGVRARGDWLEHR